MGKIEPRPALRGDYSKAATDYSVEQDWQAYTPGEHALYRRLFERQSKLVPRYACPEWIAAIAKDRPIFTQLRQHLHPTGDPSLTGR